MADCEDGIDCPVCGFFMVIWNEKEDQDLYIKFCPFCGKEVKKYKNI